MPVKRGIDENEPQDTEGNAAKWRGVETGETDTEGNGFRGNVETGEPETDDTEGQRIKFKVETGAPETDDTEGNKIKFR